MGRRSDWQRARRVAIEGQGRWRAERAAQDERCSALGVQVVLALAERDRAVAECELRAGQALLTLVEGEKLPAGEALRWCAGTISASEAARLRRLAGSAAGGSGVVSDAIAPREVRASESEPAAGGEADEGGRELRA